MSTFSPGYFKYILLANTAVLLLKQDFECSMVTFNKVFLYCGNTAVVYLNKGSEYFFLYGKYYDRYYQYDYWYRSNSL